MGCDGGSIPRRHVKRIYLILNYFNLKILILILELVKEKAKTAPIDQSNLTISKWFYCFLSKDLLTEPVVACELGNLYNKVSGE